jgi:hypothetical protein
MEKCAENVMDGLFKEKVSPTKEAFLKNIASIVDGERLLPI